MTFKSTDKRQLPYGVGCTWRPELMKLLLNHSSLVDFTEVPLNMYSAPDSRKSCDPNFKSLTQAGKSMSLTAHGPCVSIGSAEHLNALAVDNIAVLIEHFPIASYSDHLCFMNAGDRKTDSFITLPFTEMGVETAVKNIRYLKDRLGIPILIENITQHFTIPGGSLTETEFINRIVEQADCGIIIDVANLYINAKNHGFDPFEFIDNLPADRIQQCHYCGTTEAADGYLFDTHREATWEPIWELLEYTLKHTALSAIILERDSRFQYVNEIIEELWKAKELFLRYRNPKASQENSLVSWQPNSQLAPLNHNSEFRLFQEWLIRCLQDQQLAQALDNEGITVLQNSGLTIESQQAIASIPRKQRSRLASSINSGYQKPEIMPLEINQFELN